MRLLLKKLAVFLARLAVLILAVCISTQVLFANPAVNEQALTVAFLYNFLKFTEWPTSSVPDDITLCVSDSTSFGDELDALAGKSAHNKRVRIKHLELDESPLVCQLLFIPREEKPVRLQQWLKSSANSPVLLVSDVDGFLDMGGMIALIGDGDHLQFEINLAQIKSANIKLSAQLLEIARNVRDK